MIKRFISNFLFYLFIVYFVKEYIDINNNTLEYFYYGWCFVLFNTMNRSKMKEYFILISWMFLPFIVTGVLSSLTGTSLSNIFNYTFSYREILGTEILKDLSFRIGYVYLAVTLTTQMFRRMWQDLPGPSKELTKVKQ